MTQQTGNEAIAVVIEKLTEIIQTSKSAGTHGRSEPGGVEDPGNSKAHDNSKLSVQVFKLDPNKSSVSEDQHLFLSPGSGRLKTSDEDNSQLPLMQHGPLSISDDDVSPNHERDKTENCIKLIASECTKPVGQEDGVNADGIISITGYKTPSYSSEASHMTGTNVPQYTKNPLIQELNVTSQVTIDGPHSDDPLCSVPQPNHSSSVLQNAAIVSNDCGQQFIVNLPANLGKLNITNAKTLLESLIQLNSSLLKGDVNSTTSANSSGNQHSNMSTNIALPSSTCSTSLDKELYYKCAKCDYSSTNKSYLKQHVELRHNSERPFKCPFCDYAGKRSHSLKEHLVVHSTNRPYVCSMCNATFRKKGHLTNHIRLHSSQKMFTCNLCQARFEDRNDLYSHLRTVHSSEEVYSCENCIYATTIKSNIVMHMHTHGNPKTYKCNVCCFTALHVNIIKQHLSVHSGIATYHVETSNAEPRPVILLKCSECGFTSNDKDTLRNHMWEHVNGQEEGKTSSASGQEHETVSEPEKSSKALYKCSWCSYQCAEAYHFITHILSHKPLHPKQAVHAAVNSTVTSTDKAETQRTIHSNAAADVASEPSHTFTHDSFVGMYRCTICGYTCEQQRTIKAHIWRHSGHKDIGYPMFRNGPLSMYDDMPLDSCPVLLDPVGGAKPGAEMVRVPVEKTKPEHKDAADSSAPSVDIKNIASVDSSNSLSQIIKLKDLVKGRGSCEARPDLEAATRRVYSTGNSQSATATSWDSQSLQQMVDQVVIVVEESDQQTVEYSVPIHITDEVILDKNEVSVPPPMAVLSYNSQTPVSEAHEVQEVVVSTSNITAPEFQEGDGWHQLNVQMEDPIEMQVPVKKMHHDPQASPSSRGQVTHRDINRYEQKQIKYPLGDSDKNQDLTSEHSSNQPGEGSSNSTDHVHNHGEVNTGSSVPGETKVHFVDNSQESGHQEDIITSAASNPSDIVQYSISTSLAEANPEIVQLIMRAQSGRISHQSKKNPSPGNDQQDCVDSARQIAIISPCEEGNVGKVYIKPHSEVLPLGETINEKRKYDCEEEEGYCLSKRLCREEVVTTSCNVVVQRLPQSYNAPTYVMYDSRGNSPRTRSPNPDPDMSLDSSPSDTEGLKDASVYSHETVIEIHGTSLSQQPEVANHEDVDEPEPMVTLLSLLKKGPNYNPACPIAVTASSDIPEMAQDGADGTEGSSGNKPKQGICSSLLAVIEQLRERSKSESDGEDSRDGSRGSVKSTSRRRSQRNSEEDNVSLDSYENVERIEDNIFRCRLCHYTSSSLAMKSHQRLHKTKQPHECSLCSFMGESSEQLQDHMLQHCKVRTYQCKLCPSVFNYKSQLRAHMRAHNEKDPFLCDLCDFETTNPIGFRSHMRMHRDHSSHGCSQCEENFYNAEDLAAHSLTGCSSRDEEPSSTEESDSMEQSKLNSSHKQSVVKMYKCEQCEFTSVSVNAMRAHCRSHLADGDTPLHCELCDFTAMSSRSLKSHMKRHVNDQRFVQQPLEQYKCNLCGYVCHHLPSLKSHMWRHASDQNYSYQLANKVINAAIDYDSKPNCQPVVEPPSQSTDMVKTESSQTEAANKPNQVQASSVKPCFITFRCCQCGFESMDKGALGIHMKTHLDIIKKTLEVNKARINTHPKSEGQELISSADKDGKKTS